MDQDMGIKVMHEGVLVGQVPQKAVTEEGQIDDDQPGRKQLQGAQKGLGFQVLSLPSQLYPAAHCIFS